MEFVLQRLNYPQVWLFILAWFVADYLLLFLIPLGKAIGAVDKPHSYKSHKTPIPFVGGIAIYFAMLLTLFTILRFRDPEEVRPLFGILFAGFFIVMFGALDDFRPISAVLKLVVLILVTFMLSMFNISLSIFPEKLMVLNLVLTVLWLAGVTSAVNSMDNMDGSAGGISAIAAVSIFFVAWRGTPQPELSYISIALFGACLGFLRYNFPPAKVFLGDNGSLLLGFMLASLSILSSWSSDPVKSMIIPMVILVVPLFDITLSTILRIKNGVVSGVVDAIVYCGQDHLTHRLVAFGLTKRTAVLVLYLVGACAGAIAVVIDTETVGPRIYWPITVAGLVVLFIFGLILDKSPVYANLEKSTETGPSSSSESS